MKTYKFNKGIIILLIFVLVFTCMGSVSFAGKPVKEVKPATIEVVEMLPLIVPAGMDTISTDLIVKADDGNPPEYLVESEATIEITALSIKRNASTYKLTYTKSGSDVTEDMVVVTVKNPEGKITAVDIPIQIEGSDPPVNEAPVNITSPDIESTFIAGDMAMPISGEWFDDQPGLVVTATWELSNGESFPVTGEVELISDWIGLSIAIKEVAVDEFGLTSTAISGNHLIEEQVVANDVIYVALGDSIATGTVAPTIPDETTYVDYFGDFLGNQTGRNIITKDFSADGDQTSHLLSRLKGDDPEMIAQLQLADVITLSIGGNNLMSAAKYETMFLGFIPVEYYDFDNIDLDKAEAGRIAFVSDFPQIIQKIRQYNQSAQVIVNTIYNPFNGTQDAVNHVMVENYLYREDGNGINDVILSTPGIDVAPVHQAFESSHYDTKNEITYMYIDDRYFGFELRNPHPNSEGQLIIEAMHELVFRIF